MLQAEVPTISLSDGRQDGADSGGSMRRIAVLVNASPGSDAAVTFAARLCVVTGGELLVLHVRAYDPPVHGAGRFYPESSEDAKSLVTNAVAWAWACGARASAVVVDAPRKKVAGTVSGTAHDWNADVIVLARPARPTISRLVFGSVSDQVMRRADCAVLVVRPDTTRRFFGGSRACQ